MRIIGWIVVLLLAVGWAPAAHASDDAALNVDLDLADGTRLTGTAPDVKARLTSPYGRVEFAFSAVARLTLGDDKETVRVTMRNEDVIHGVLEDVALDVRRYGGDEIRRVRLRDVRSLRVTPPIRIAGSADARWEVRFVHALGWTTNNGGEELTVDHIDPERINTGSGGFWSTVQLVRTDPAPRKDFDFEAQIAWDSKEAAAAAMHALWFSFVDADGRVLIEVGHHDAWSGSAGRRFSNVGGTPVVSGDATQPFTGRARIEVTRRDGKVTIKWNDKEMQTAELATPIHRVQVRFDYYAYRVGIDESAFGSLTLERLKLR